MQAQAVKAGLEIARGLASGIVVFAGTQKCPDCSRAPSLTCASCSSETTWLTTVSSIFGLVCLGLVCFSGGVYFGSSRREVFQARDQAIPKSRPRGVWLQDGVGDGR